jgi:hypothetical protein
VSVRAYQSCDHRSSGSLEPSHSPEIIGVRNRSSRCPHAERSPRASSESHLTSPLPLELGETPIRIICSRRRVFNPGKRCISMRRGPTKYGPECGPALPALTSSRSQMRESAVTRFPTRRNGSGRSGPAWSCPGRILPLPRRPLRGRRGESPPREEVRVASVEAILMADPRSWVAAESFAASTPQSFGKIPINASLSERSWVASQNFCFRVCAISAWARPACELRVALPSGYFSQHASYPSPPGLLFQ